MPLWKALMPCGKKESSKSIIFRLCPNSEEPQSSSCATTITKNPTELLAKKNMAPGFQGSSGIAIGPLSGISQRVLPCTPTSTPMATSAFQLQEEKSHTSEKSTSTAESNLTVQAISSKENSKTNMWLPPSTLTEGAWWSNKGPGSSSHSLSPSRAPLLIHCCVPQTNPIGKFAML